jgi:AraC-like DNA-binding protein
LSNNIITGKLKHIQNEGNIVLPKEKALIKSDVIHITDHIKIYRNNFQIYQDSIAQYKSNFNGITINICFEANHHYLSDISNFKINPLSNHTIINFINKDQGQIFYKKNSKIKNIMIYIKFEFLKYFFKENLNIKKFIYTIKKQNSSCSIKVKKTDSKTKLCAVQIDKSLCKSTFDLLFIQSKVLEILSYELSDLFTKRDINEKNIKFSSYDIQALYKAKELLSNELQNPPSIAYLSKLVKLNEFKLKYGFKNFFKTTPRNFIIENRMIKAKNLLESSDLNISEIAQEIGYKQSHNLTSTFFKFYGIKPKDVIKNRKLQY